MRKAWKVALLGKVCLGELYIFHPRFEPIQSNPEVVSLFRLFVYPCDLFTALATRFLEVAKWFNMASPFKSATQVWIPGVSYKIDTDCIVKLGKTSETIGFDTSAFRTTFLIPLSKFNWSYTLHTDQEEKCITNLPQHIHVCCMYACLYACVYI